MEPTPKPHVSHAIAWSLIALFAGSLAFGIWMYSNQIDTIYSGSANLSVTHKKTATKPTTATTDTTTTTDATADWKTYTNTTDGYSIKYPKDLTYEVINSGKNIVFQTSADKAKYNKCMETDGVECIRSSQLEIGTDEAVGATNGDDISLTLDQIIQHRTTGIKNPIKITLSNQPAYEWIDEGMFAVYGIISKYNNHIYDIRLVQNCSNTPVTIETCKKEVTNTAETMLSTFTFTK